MSALVSHADIHVSWKMRVTAKTKTAKANSFEGYELVERDQNDNETNYQPQ
jgi:hypothetical protein